MKPIILHISSDYPDSLNPRKTRAISSLIDETPEYRHVVYSLNRFTALGGLAALPFGEDRTAIAYGALPKGLLWGPRLAALAEWIIGDMQAKGISPTLVKAHKFTVEGLIGQRIAQAFSCPLICDIQGNTDVMILKNKPGFRSRYRTIAQEAALVFPFAPWVMEPFERLAGLAPEKAVLLPVMPAIDTLSPAPALASGRILSVFNLDSWGLKNLTGLLGAVSALQTSRPGLSLDIYGQGGPVSVCAVRHHIDKAGLRERVTLKGPVENAAMPDIMKRYDAFVMPTLRETYGLVHIEALFAGVPVLFSKGRGIDGYFKAEDIGYACDPRDVQDIAAGIEHLLTHEAALKERIGAMQAHGDFSTVRRGHIIQTYRQGLSRVLEQK